MEEQKTEQKIDLTSFKRANAAMIATNAGMYGINAWDSWRRCIESSREYTTEEVIRIIHSGSLAEQQALSQSFFYRDGYYRQIILHYATLLKYAGLLVPNPAYGKNLSTPHIRKRYFMAMDYVEKMSLPIFFANCAQRALVNGTYYGVKVQVDNKHFAVLDLPCAYCRSRFKDADGNDLVEFDVSYFNTIVDEDARKAALAVYPKIVSKAYKEWLNAKKKKTLTGWIVLPADIGICFPFFDGRPLFLSVILRSLEYDQAVETEQERDLEEIRKIIVQKIPHTADGRLVFEPDEAAEMHAGAVGMLKKNEHLSVLTTYADVEAITSKTSADNANNVLERMEQNIYAQAGVSGELFGTESATALEKSLDNDLALMMTLGYKFANFVTNVINGLFANSNITFKYSMLPVSYYNATKFVDTSFKLVGSGYSFLMPAVSMGMSQKDLVNIKDLENNVLKLRECLVPLETSYTMSGKNQDEEGGRPQMETEDKQEVTVVTEESRENAEGGS